MPVVPSLNNDTYLSYQALEEYMYGVAQAVPHLVRVISIGKSSQGHDLLVAEVTNQGTGDAGTKAALWVDGNACGSQLASSTVCLALLQKLASAHGHDQQVTDLLDSRAFYIMPRLCVDGAELCIATGLASDRGRRLGFSPGIREGLVPGDVNGNGRISQMRLKHPLGEWKVSRRDPRLMLPRLPGENVGPFYHLYCEGYFDSDLDSPEQVRPSLAPLDLVDTFTAGGIKSSEMQAVVDFIKSRQNICLALGVGSGQGVVSTLDKQDLISEDSALAQSLCHTAAEVTGLDVEASIHSNGLAQWLYKNRGILPLSLSVWNLPKCLGIEHSLDSFSENDYLAVLRWVDREYAGQGFENWQPCRHPQLGDVEVGGWQVASTWINPPAGQLLQEQCRLGVDMALLMAASMPCLVLAECNEEVVGWTESANPQAPDDLLPLRKVDLVVANDGYLPMWGSNKLVSSAVPLTVSLELGQEQELLMGQAWREDAALTGVFSASLQANANSVFFFGGNDTGRRSYQWLVRGWGDLVIKATHPRGGVVAVSLDGNNKTTLIQGCSLSNGVAVAVKAATYQANSQLTTKKASSARDVGGANRAAVLARAAVPPVSEPPITSKTSVSQPAPVARHAAVSEAASGVRPVNLTEVTRVGVETASPEAAPRKGVPAMSGYRPAAKLPHVSSTDEGGRERPKSVPAARSTTNQQAAVEATMSSLVREESPLRKDSASSGRVLGQSPSKPGTRQALGRSPGHSSRQSLDDIPLPETRPDPRNVRPHSLIGSGTNRSGVGPQDSAPENLPPVPENDQGLEGPPAVSKATGPQLLRRRETE